MNNQPPPFSEESERGALGCLLTEPQEAQKRLVKLKGSDFHDLRHKAVFTAISCLSHDARVPDVATVGQWLKDKGRLEEAGGWEYLAPLPDAPPSAANFDNYLLTLKDKTGRREALHLSSKLADMARDESVDPRALIHDARSYFEHALTYDHGRKEWFRFFKPSELSSYNLPPNTVLVGDSHIARGNVTVIAGAPGVGKSRASDSLAIAGARPESSWFGLPVHGQFKTAVIQNENGRYRLKTEFADIGADGLDDYIRVSEPPPFGMAFDKPEFREALRTWLDEFKPDVVILDPWNSMARDDGARDYLETLNLLRGVVFGQSTSPPALVIVAHTRKPKSDERNNGRNLLNDVAGSYVLASVPRCVFILQAGSEEPEDDRVVWTCCKNNDGDFGPRSAWHRRNGLFLPCSDFNWSDFDKPTGNDRKEITQEHMEALFKNGQRKLEKKHACKELQSIAEMGHTACYNALSVKGKFRGHLVQHPDGLLGWKP